MKRLGREALKILHTTKAQRPYSGLPLCVLATLSLMMCIPEIAQANSPARIASLSLASDEILLELLPACGGVQRLAAVSIFADDPESSSMIEAAKSVKGRVHSEPESLMALNPDLVIAASFNRPELLKMVQARNIPLLTLKEFSSAEDIAGHILAIGERIGCRARAETLRDQFMKRVVAVPIVGKPMRVILYNPDLTVMGQGTLFDDLVRRVGAINVISERGLKRWPRIDVETLLATNPDKVIVLGQDSAKTRASIRNHPSWGRLKAVQKDQFVFLDSKTAQSTSHFFANAVQDLRRKLNP